jgi:hypothetical protein
MAFELTTSIIINSTKETIWNHLTDFNSYSEWNPFIKSITNIQGINKSFSAHIQNMKFTPKLLVFDEGKELKWIGRLLIAGIFDGTHRFQIKTLQNGACEFIQSESFSGILVPFMKRKLNSDIKAGFNDMNMKLKERCESKSPII